MNTKKVLLGVCSFTLLLVQGALAGDAGYECIVKEELHLTDNGGLEPYPHPLVLGKHFSVHRITGVLVETQSYPTAWSPVDARVSVLSRGNKDNSFIVSYVAPARGDGVHMTVLRIEEFRQSSRKPFMLISGGSSYSGTCE